jgi:hypothetical protein
VTLWKKGDAREVVIGVYDTSFCRWLKAGSSRHRHGLFDAEKPCVPCLVDFAQRQSAGARSLRLFAVGKRVRGVERIGMQVTNGVDTLYEEFVYFL